MEIKELDDNGSILKIVVNSNEESLFSLLKDYLQKNDLVDLCGVVKDHYLVDETEFHLKVKKGSALKLFKDSLAEIKKDLESKKIK